MIALHPQPVLCRNCGTVLEATFAEANGFCCPECGEPACYFCGCVEQAACSIEVTNGDKLNTTSYVCGWSSMPGACSFCQWRIAYEFYQEATGRPADDPFYLSLGREPRAFKGLSYGV